MTTHRRALQIGCCVFQSLLAVILVACGNSSSTERLHALEKALDTRRPTTTCLANPPAGCPDAARHVRDISASANGNRVALFYDDGRVDVWDLDQGKKVFVLPATRVAPSGWLSPRGDRIMLIRQAALGGEVLQTWKVPGSRPIVQYDLPDGGLPLAVTPNGRDILVNLFDPLTETVKGLPLVLVKPPGVVAARGGTTPGFGEAVFAPAQREFVIITAFGYLRWSVGRRVVAVHTKCSSRAVLSGDGSAYACLTAGSPVELLGEIAVWGVHSGHLIQRWAPSPKAYGGGVLAENKVISVALLDNGRELAMAVSWKGLEGQHDRVIIVRVSDHSIIATHDLPIARRFKDVVGALLTPVGDMVVADQYNGRFGHRLFVFSGK